MQLPEEMLLDPSLVLYLPLWKRDGAIIVSDDASGTSCPQTNTVWGMMGRAFNGTNSRITCESNPSILPAAWTIEAWIKRVSGRHTLVSFNNGGSQYGLVGFGVNSGSDDAAIYMGSANYRTFTIPPRGVFQHVAFTIPGNAQTDISSSQFFLNGIPQNTSATVATGAQLGKTILYIGTDATTNNDPFNGTIGELRLYNRPLTLPEVRRNYELTKFRYQ